MNRRLVPGVDSKRGRRRCRSVCPCGGEASSALGFLVGGLKALKFNVFLAQVLWAFVCL